MLGPWLSAAYPEGSLFEASSQVLFFDYLRIPYRVVPGGSGPLNCMCRAGAGGRRALFWPTEASLSGLEPEEYRFGDVTVFARVIDDGSARRMLPGGRSWDARPGTGVPQVPSEWRSDEGDCFLPFDPGEAIQSYWSEGYEQVRTSSRFRSVVRIGRRSYYRLRPLLPRSLQIAARRLVSRAQARRTFPAWPLETSLHDLYDVLLGIAAEIAGEPVPWIAPWPGGHKWALVLTHDVETEYGCEHLGRLRDVELAAGLRSSWNFVPERYPLDDALLEVLRRDGFEIGVHGLYHDGRDLESEALLRRRAPAMRRYGERWHAVGFRSPATHRSWNLMPLLPFEYDSSYPDTDPYEPVSGGCCSWLPYHIGELVELPITLPQDHTLFVILGETDESIWVEKTRQLRDRGGMALVITHPDYMVDQTRVAAYERFLATFAGDDTGWKALPHEVSTWWRERAASSIERSADAWRIIGPAAERGRIVNVARAQAGRA